VHPDPALAAGREVRILGRTLHADRALAAGADNQGGHVASLDPHFGLAACGDHGHAVSGQNGDFALASGGQVDAANVAEGDLLLVLRRDLDGTFCVADDQVSLYVVAHNRGALGNRDGYLEHLGISSTALNHHDGAIGSDPPAADGDAAGRHDVTSGDAAGTEGDAAPASRRGHRDRGAARGILPATDDEPVTHEATTHFALVRFGSVDGDRHFGTNLNRNVSPDALQVEGLHSRESLSFHWSLSVCRFLVESLRYEVVENMGYSRLKSQEIYDLRWL
jgi:hypothetical protein